MLEVKDSNGKSKFIAQSSAICEYLDEIGTKPSLVPGALLDRAAVRAICMSVASGVQPFQNTATLKYVSAAAKTSGSDPKVLRLHAIGRGLLNDVCACVRRR